MSDSGVDDQSLTHGTNQTPETMTSDSSQTSVEAKQDQDITLNTSEASAAQQLAPTSFPAFPKLPAELRLKVWSYLTPAPRAITLSYSTILRLKGRRPQDLDTFRSKIVAGPLTKPPILLQICHETRAFLQRTYQPAFHDFHRPIYFNKQVDVVTGQETTAVDILCRLVEPGVELFPVDVAHFALDYGKCDCFNLYVIVNIILYSREGVLRSITIVTDAVLPIADLNRLSDATLNVVVSECAIRNNFFFDPRKDLKASTCLTREIFQRLQRSGALDGMLWAMKGKRFTFEMMPVIRVLSKAQFQEMFTP